MMDRFRMGSYGWPVKLMLGCMVVVMVVGGLNLPVLLGLGGGQFVAKVDRDELTNEQFVSAFQATLQSINKSYPGTGYSTSERLQWAVMQREQFVERMLLEQYGERLQLGGSELEVKAQLKAFPEFQDESGAFSSEKYAAFFKRSFISPEKLARWIRQDLLHRAVSRALKGTEWLLPSERDEQFALLAEQRRAQLVVLPLAPYLEKIQVNDQQVQEYYRDHQRAFLEPVRIGLEYLSFDLSELAALFEISKEEMEADYAAHQSSLYQTPESIEFSLMLLPSRERADHIRKLLTEHPTRFEQFARTYSVDRDSERVSRGGKAGWSAVAELHPTLSAALLKLKNGEVSEVLQLDQQYALVRREDYRAAAAQPLSEVASAIKDSLQREKARRQIQQWSERGFSSSELTTYAGRLHQSLCQVNPQPIEAYSEWAGGPSVLSKIFPDPARLKTGQTLPLIVHHERYLMSRVTEIEPARPYPLEQVRAKIVDIIGTRQAKEEARRDIGKWLTALHAGELTLEELVQANGLDKPVDYLIRRSELSSSPHFAALFDWVAPSSNRPVYGQLEDKDRLFLAALVESIPGSYYQEGSDRVALQLYEQLELQTERALVEFCRSQAKIRYGSSEFLQSLVEQVAISSGISASSS